jgi:methyltransferase-like protein/2-polyprenyl-3-methyl-5-hydroxy-6-metoxy-1,4-benzoquinol methylase
MPETELDLQRTQRAYDEVPYHSYPFPQTHPERLAIIAHLFGMEPPDIERAHVLELGCAGGGNLIPMAAALPDAKFLGIDLSARQIDEGKSLLSELGLSNIELRQASITDVDPSYGDFDYIICHGVYSWVPEAVQAHILKIAQRQLSPNGVVYVSYNTYPGWRMRSMIRDMMLYHTRGFQDPAQKISQSRALLKFLADAVPTENNAYGLLLKSELDLLQRLPDAYLRHEQLEDVNAPIYFHQFAERAAARGLQYMGEADFHAMPVSNFPIEVVETLKRTALDLVRMEQYMDFLRNQSFRQTLLVRDDVPLNRNVGWERVQSFYAASAARPASERPDPLTEGKQSFCLPSGMSIDVEGNLTKAALLELRACWPAPISFEQLLAGARARLDPMGRGGEHGEQAEQDVQALAVDLLQAYSFGAVEFRKRPQPITLAIAERPLVWPLARLQAQRAPQGAGAAVTSPRHETVHLDEYTRQVVCYLDGAHDRNALLNHLEEMVAQGALVVQEHDQPIKDAVQLHNHLVESLAGALTRLGRQGLLMLPEVSGSQI